MSTNFKLSIIFIIGAIFTLLSVTTLWINDFTLFTHIVDRYPFVSFGTVLTSGGIISAIGHISNPILVYLTAKFAFEEKDNLNKYILYMGIAATSLIVIGNSFDAILSLSRMVDTVFLSLLCILIYDKLKAHKKKIRFLIPFLFLIIGANVGNNATGFMIIASLVLYNVAYRGKNTMLKYLASIILLSYLFDLWPTIMNSFQAPVPTLVFISVYYLPGILVNLAGVFIIWALNANEGKIIEEKKIILTALLVSPISVYLLNFFGVLLYS